MAIIDSFYSKEAIGIKLQNGRENVELHWIEAKGYFDKKRTFVWHTDPRENPKRLSAF
jgi:hypothetical protein